MARKYSETPSLGKNQQWVPTSGPSPFRETLVGGTDFPPLRSMEERALRWFDPVAKAKSRKSKNASGVGRRKNPHMDTPVKEEHPHDGAAPVDPPASPPADDLDSLLQQWDESVGKAEPATDTAPEQNLSSDQTFDQQLAELLGP